MPKLLCCRRMNLPYLVCYTPSLVFPNCFATQRAKPLNFVTRGHLAFSVQRVLTFLPNASPPLPPHPSPPHLPRPVLFVSAEVLVDDEFDEEQVEHADQQKDGHPEEGGQSSQRVAVSVHRHQVVVVCRRWRSTQTGRQTAEVRQPPDSGAGQTVRQPPDSGAGQRRDRRRSAQHCSAPFSIAQLCSAARALSSNMQNSPHIASRHRKYAQQTNKYIVYSGLK